MLAYAASAPRTADRSSSPNAMLAIIAGHVALVAVVMSARMDLPARFIDKPIEVSLVPSPQPPPPDQPPERPQPQQPSFTQPDPSVPLPPVDTQPVNPTPPTPIIDPGPGPSVDPPPPVRQTPSPVSFGARLLTSGTALKPPYPPSKLLAEEEATLKLRLTIDEHGRVIAVEPVGPADPVFLDAARRYLLAHWRYQPATEDGRAVTATQVISLSFELDG